MKGIMNIPEGFFSLFNSKNRYIYIESLILIYDEYLYNDYFLTKDTCIQLLEDLYANRIVDISADDADDDTDMSEPVAARIFYKLVKFGWLRRIEDYGAFKTYVVIADYASAFIETFKKINDTDSDETDLYIQNIYTNIYSFYHDNKAGIELLKTAMVNTAKLNRTLQEMLHNMDKFFEALLKQDNYEDLLTEHLNGYVENVVNKKYAILKTGDNFYIYKNDIKTLLKQIREDEERLDILKTKMSHRGQTPQEVEYEIMDMIESIERGIANMEKRISRIDTEHSKYIRATVRRLEYMLNNDDSVRGDIINLLGIMNEGQSQKITDRVSKIIKLNDSTIISQELLYKKRGKRKTFEDTVEAFEALESDLSAEEILKLNQNKNRYSNKEIENYIMDNMHNGIYKSSDNPVNNEKDFELLILAYDYSIRKNSPFSVKEIGEGIIINENYSYPELVFKIK